MKTPKIASFDYGQTLIADRINRLLPVWYMGAIDPSYKIF